MLATLDPVSALEHLTDDELIPLPILADSIGLNRGQRDYAVRKGIIKTAQAPKTSRAGRPNGCHMVTKEEGLLLLACAALASAIGIALVTVVRTLRDSGCRITPDGLLVPLQGLSLA